VATEHIVQLLIQERDRLERAIHALQGEVKRRGRPPKKTIEPIFSTGPELENPPVPQALEAAGEKVPKKRKGFSAATKRKMALAQKKRWAAIKAAK
jgi:hypothetical protein